MLAPTGKLHFSLSVSSFGSTQLSSPSVSSATFKRHNKREFKKLSPLQVGAKSLTANLQRVQQSVAKCVMWCGYWLEKKSTAPLTQRLCSTANVDDLKRAIPHPQRPPHRHVAHHQRQPLRHGGLAGGGGGRGGTLTCSQTPFIPFWPSTTIPPDWLTGWLTGRVGPSDWWEPEEHRVTTECNLN